MPGGGEIIRRAAPASSPVPGVISGLRQFHIAARLFRCVPQVVFLKYEEANHHEKSHDQEGQSYTERVGVGITESLIEHRQYQRPKRTAQADGERKGTVIYGFPPATGEHLIVIGDI